ncbi:MAG TPA: nucleotidyl transferase AbiEii/AbiGii toxin family protein [Vicinamibacterales bacterium]|jgi:hypothetical protein|nr:nucleotidyl transferase AbiEii/AbiGii toxin family protein [Vicinamibacterales bacterium]
MSDLAGVLAAAAEVEAFCRNQGWRFCFIGGIAVQRWGMPRFTQDVDLTLLTGFGSEQTFVDPLLRQFSARIRDARQFALNHRVLLARTAHGVDLDFALGALPFEEGSVSRASSWPASDAVSLTTCSAEDLIVHKVFASRERDWADIESILSRQHGALDFAHVRKELRPLLELKDDQESLARLDRLVSTVDERLQQ